MYLPESVGERDMSTGTLSAKVLGSPALGIWITLLHIINEGTILSRPVPSSKSSSQCVLSLSISALLCKILENYRFPSSSKLTTYIHAVQCAIG